MGQVRHGSAATTFAVRAAIQRSQAPLSALSEKLGGNPKTVANWRRRATDGCQLAEAGNGRGSQDVTARTAIFGPDRSGRGRDRRISA